MHTNDVMDRLSMLAVDSMFSETEIPSHEQPAVLFRESGENPVIAVEVKDRPPSHIYSNYESLKLYDLNKWSHTFHKSFD